MFASRRKPDPPSGANVVPLPARNAENVLRRLEWTVLRRLDGLLHGDYRTLFRGFGLDLADLREYQYHDDVRHIDWNVTARLQTPYVREYNEDRDVTAWFLLDVSPSVDFGSGDVRKRSVATDFVTVLARILTRHGNRVGAAFYGETMDTVIPAVEAARARGCQVFGPFAPDTVFMRARHAAGHPGEFDVVVAMYHDQGLIPVKYLGVEQGVNVTLGLPLVRTSPDHGTAFDIAGTGRADPSSLLAAIRMARQLLPT